MDILDYYAKSKDTRMNHLTKEIVFPHMEVTDYIGFLDISADTILQYTTFRHSTDGSMMYSHILESHAKICIEKFLESNYTKYDDKHASYHFLTNTCFTMLE